MGGISIVRSELPYLKLWLEKKVQWKCFDECYLLASGLAWMELYELEVEVLRYFVQAKVQLPDEMQERLKFLESSGTTNVEIYDVKEGAEFLFDSSSLEWSPQEYSVFFRKINMKKIWPNYSLVINKWTKTIPLLKGQKVLFDTLHTELASMTEDFDGEIVCKRISARAINLENLIYEDAVAFYFTTERNRCISVLFSAEKYGRNLNLTAYTLFTPDKNIALNALEKYCNAIKENTYVESLKESILQTIDEMLQVKESVYEDLNPRIKKDIFDEY